MHYTSARKLIGALVLLIVAVVMTYIKGDIPTNLTNFMEMIYITFVLGNGLEYFTQLKTGASPAPTKGKVKCI